MVEKDKELRGSKIQDEEISLKKRKVGKDIKYETKSFKKRQEGQIKNNT